jgi:diaminohydroxyphosphoribosylaminopyrimidine deaminase/5-amino-6-(5-phosphoribosylamino)uracil reductase
VTVLCQLIRSDLALQSIPVPLKDSDRPTSQNGPIGQAIALDDAAIANSWAEFTEIFRQQSGPLRQPWCELFGPLRTGTIDDLVVVGQLGQSLDGRIATESGHSKYINGPAGLDHLHRLRALVDAVVIGVGTALADDPQLTVRRVAGPQPARIVIDPNSRLPASARVLANDGVRRLVLTAEGSRCAPPPGVEVVRLPAAAGRIVPTAILAALAERGLRRLLIEGGAETVSRFLAAGCLDRLHVMVAPIILGSGRGGFVLPPIERADQAMRVLVHAHQLNDEVLFDLDLSAQRVAVGAAKKST